MSCARLRVATRGGGHPTMFVGSRSHGVAFGSTKEHPWFSEGGSLRGGKGGESLPMRVEECPKSRNPRWDPPCDWKQRGEFVFSEGGPPQRRQGRGVPSDEG